MAYVALYRQWRPQDFEHLVGQEHISVTLKNALLTGRIAHAYLFAGPRGTGKTSTAKILAKALNCVNGPTPTPCNVCSNCERITAGSSMDVFEIDAASNRGIDEIRDLRETVKFAPVDGGYKVYIIDEVHMLTTEAFNALLKTLEEPPAHVVFILATTEAHKIPATIHSRCQRYDFRRISVKEIEERLQEVVRDGAVQVEPEALRLIAIHADGGMRDALSVFDQCTTMDGETITAVKVRQLLGLIGHEWVWRLTEALGERDARATMQTLDEMISMGKDVRQILTELSLHIRSLMLYKAAPDTQGIEMYSEDRTVLAAHSEKFTHAELVEAIQGLHEAANEAKWAIEPRITAEMAFLSICRRAAGRDLSALLERITNLEKKLAYWEGQGESRILSATVAAEMPIKTTINPPIAVERASSAVNSAVQPATPKTMEKQRETPDKLIVSSPVRKVTEEVTAASRPLNKDIKSIWDSVLKELLASGKRSVHACVSQGKLLEMDDTQATVCFAAAFSKERTEKEDFRAIIENILEQVSGNKVRLNCILGNADAMPKTTPVAAKVVKTPVEKPVVEVPVDGVEHPAVRQALMMFGGKAIKEE